MIEKAKAEWYLWGGHTYGVDTDVVEMRVEDGLKELTCMDEYSYEYLSKCRQILMNKVREKLEQEKYEKKQEVWIQSIRSFYTNIAIAPSRTG